MLALAVSALAACSVSTPSANARINLKPLPAAATHCEDPVLLPEVALNQEQVEKFWRRDRMSLVNCKKNLNIVVKDRENLSTLLSGAGLY